MGTTPPITTNNPQNTRSTKPDQATSKELYGLGKQLLHVKDREQAASWIDTYLDWCKRWEGFLAQKTKRGDGGWEYTHE